MAQKRPGNETRRRGGLRPLGKALRPLMRPLLKKRPPLEAALLLDWQDAVGQEIAAFCQPLALRPEGPAGAKAGALELACLSWAALELQHRAPQLIGRVNTFLGVRAVERLRIKQVARLPGPGAAPAGLPVPPPEPLKGLPGSGHEALDRALARLAGTLASRCDQDGVT
ncbi:MAG: DUF721 domain-containing protein [Rhodospirillales bacterium]|nr:DUF721 domain-containing protein [Rhodospirillales bacterium]